MKVRLDIDQDERGPKLVGLHITGWAWLLGGGSSGAHTIQARLVGTDTESGELLQLLDQQDKQRLAHPGKLWPTKAYDDARTPEPEPQEPPSDKSPRHEGFQEELEIERVMVFSTAHIKEADSRLLHSEMGFLTVVDRPEGWFIRIPDEDGMEELPAELENAGLSTCISHLLSVAGSHNCNWILLDADGPCYDSFPQYHW